MSSDISIGTDDDPIDFQPDESLDEPQPEQRHPKSIEWTQSRHDRPRITYHAQQRWDERTPWWSRSIEYAYTAGVPIFEFRSVAFRDKDGNEPDRVRVFGENTEHGKYAALMFIVNDAVTTVYPVAKAFLSGPMKAYLWAVLDQNGHLELESEPHEGKQN